MREPSPGFPPEAGSGGQRRTGYLTRAPGAEHGEPDLDLPVAVAAEPLPTAGRTAGRMAAALAAARGA
jgi:hypothetical protein